MPLYIANTAENPILSFYESDTPEGAALQCASTLDNPSSVLVSVCLEDGGEPVTYHVRVHRLSQGALGEPLDIGTTLK